MLIETLLLFAAVAPEGAFRGPIDASPLRAQEATASYESLVEAYEAAEARWRERLKAAEGTKERRAVRDAHPARDFAARFEALAGAGEGRALLWRARHLRELGLGSRERGVALGELFTALVDGHAREPWFTEVPRELLQQRRLVGEERALALLTRLDAEGVPDETRAEALAGIVSLLERSEAEGAAERAAVLEDRLEAELGNTRAGMAVRAKRAAARTQPGAAAPGGAGGAGRGVGVERDEDRGKVVLLDFYGFW